MIDNSAWSMNSIGIHQDRTKSYQVAFKEVTRRQGGGPGGVQGRRRGRGRGRRRGSRNPRGSPRSARRVEGVSYLR